MGAACATSGCTSDYRTGYTSNSYTGDYKDDSPNKFTQMKVALNQQNLAIVIEADKMMFQIYNSSVLTDSRCGTSLDHTVLAVGYGTENDQDYWQVKNSWNITLGDQGYSKLGMNSDARVCVVQMDPQSVTTN